MLGGRAFSVWTPFHHPIGRQPPSPHAPLEGPLRHLVAPDILERRLIRGPAEEDRELLDEATIDVLGRRLKLTDRHILDHAPAQRAYGRIGHEVLLSEWRLAIPHPQTGPAGLEAARILSPSKARALESKAAPGPGAFYRVSGFVLWHIPVIVDRGRGWVDSYHHQTALSLRGEARSRRI